MGTGDARISSTVMPCSSSHSISSARSARALPSRPSSSFSTSGSCTPPTYNATRHDGNPMTTPPLEGFPPVVDDNADLLILGSFPSVQSLATHQYYGNPRNAFWPITADLFGFDASAPYETRLAALQSAGVAVWDVLHKCRRAGSSDAKFDMKSLVANDFGQLFAAYPSITRVCFNGRAGGAALRTTGRRRRCRRVSAVAVDQPGPGDARGSETSGLAGYRAVMTPAVAAAPTVGLPRSARSATAASPRRLGRPTS